MAVSKAFLFFSNFLWKFQIWFQKFQVGNTLALSKIWVSLFSVLLAHLPFSFRVSLPTLNSKNINSSWTSLLSWPRFGCCQYCGFRDPCLNLSIIGFTKMNKHLVGNFLAFRNRQGRLRDAKKDQEDSLGDEVLATDQGERGRMVRPWREVDGRILILGFRSISFLIRNSFSTIVVRLSKVFKCCQL